MTAALLYMYGALSLGCFAIALFFVRYYRLAKDELFLWFSGSFATLGFHWTVLALGAASEHAHLLYLVRLVAFLMIIVAILRKNRAAKRA